MAATNRVFQKHTSLRNPHTKEIAYFRPGMILPSWAEGMVRNPDLFGEPPRDPLLDYEEWTTGELRKELKRRGLSMQGSKSERITRLEEWDAEERARHALVNSPLVSVSPIDPVEVERENAKKIEALNKKSGYFDDDEDEEPETEADDDEGDDDDEDEED